MTVGWPRALMIVALSATIFALAWGPGALSSMDPETPEQAADFPNYWFGGERLRDGRPVYDVLEDDFAERFGVSGYDTYPADPPPTVVLFSPLSFLDYPIAWVVWQIISATLVFTAIHIVSREVGYSPAAATAIAAASFVTSPVRFLLGRNHMESVLLMLGVLGWRALRRGGRGEIAWGLATGLKLFPGMWLLGLWSRHRRRTLVGLAVAAGLLIVGSAVLGPDNLGQFVGETVPGSRRWYGTLGNYSLLSVGTAFAGVWLGWVLLGAGLVTLGPRYLRGGGDPDRAYVLGTALALLVSPLSWLNYLVLVIPALIMLSCHLDLTGSPSHRIGFVALLVALLGWGPIVTSSELVSEVASFVPTAALVALFLIADRRMETTRWHSMSETPHLPTS